MAVVASAERLLSSDAEVAGRQSDRIKTAIMNFKYIPSILIVL
jgi:hypothetical protein